MANGKFQKCQKGITIHSAICLVSFFDCSLSPVTCSLSSKLLPDITMGGIRESNAYLSLDRLERSKRC